MLASGTQCVEFVSGKTDTDEKTVEKMHPFAYTLISKKGIILERLSHNLIADTEFEPISQLLELLHSFTKITPVHSS